MIHRHHIIPKHMGGDDSKNNLIDIPYWAHIEVHKRLWEVYGKLEDKLAYYMLSGKTEEAEKVRIELAKNKFKVWLKENPEEVKNWKKNISNSLKGKRFLPDEHYKKQAEKFRGIPRSQEVKDKISKAKKGKSVAQPNQMKTYEVIKPNGEVLVVRGLNEFCKNEGINASNLCAVVKGRIKQHKGYVAKLIE
ncbi:MAG: hypothetical protein ACO3EY_06950 [Candidatus Nanopelagicales bacterium]